MNQISTLVLDSEGLSRWIARDRATTALIEAARRDNIRIVVGANTIPEVTHSKVDRARLRWLLSQVTVVPVTQEAAVKASDLLAAAGMHGHRHTIDSTVVGAALAQSKPVAVLTSDPGDIGKLADGQVRVIPV